MAAEKSAAELLRSLREKQGRSLRAVATEMGVAPSQLSRLETGERAYNQGLGDRLAKYYGISPETLELMDGRIPADIVQILQDHPEEISRLRNLYGGLRAGADVERNETTGLD